MALDHDFLQKLICPRTRQPLLLVGEAELGTWNTAIAAGAVRTRGGEPVDTPLTAALAPAGAGFCYRIDGDIPILLADEALERTAGDGPDAATP